MRQLRFHSIDDAIRELEEIESSVVETTGLWSLGQIYQHCAINLEHIMSSYPRILPLFVRRTIGPWAFRSMLKKGYMTEGNINPNAPKVREEIDFGPELKRLKANLIKFRNYEGPFPEHPFFGKLSLPEWKTLQSYHLANHLGNIRIIAPKRGKSERSGRPAGKKGAKKKLVKKTSGKKKARK